MAKKIYTEPVEQTAEMQPAEQPTETAPTEPKETEKPAEQPAECPLQKKADKLFKVYPDVNKIFFTSDANGFINENAAMNHAKTLEDKTIKTVEI